MAEAGMHAATINSRARENRCVLACTKWPRVIAPAQMFEQACIVKRSCTITTANLPSGGLRRRVPPPVTPGYLCFFTQNAHGGYSCKSKPGAISRGMHLFGFTRLGQIPTG